MPAMPPAFPFLDHPGPIPFAHRGGSAEGPENSLATFEHAIQLGFRYLETDAQLSLDGVLVAMHDATLDRTTDRRGAVADLTWCEISEARLRNPDGSISDQHPARLEDVFTSWPDVMINIDAKHNRAVEPLVALVKAQGALGRTCLGSFSDARTAKIRRQLGASLCTVCGPVDVVRLRLGAAGRPFGSVQGSCAQVPVRQTLLGPVSVRVVDGAFVRSAHRHGVPVHVWTVDDADTMRELLDLGVDGIMTDRPTVLKQVLQDRGQWFGG
jgi:glycerophosphoryl diester phosphodiesterase